MKNWRYRNHFFILLNPHYINLTQNSSSTICFSEILQFKIDNYHLKSLSVNHQFATFASGGQYSNSYAELYRVATYNSTVGLA